MTRYSKDLRNLYDELMNGHEYGEVCRVLNDAAFPGYKYYFSPVLYLFYSENTREYGKAYFRTINYGSTAFPATLSGLNSALSIMFNKTAREFIAYYITRDEAKEMPLVSA